ncbi:MAG TPA: Fic family protein [Candidatus Dormibacteraeota bacterium]|nr:Fic family protein [Candidatus Dormibacteraeota bacterium]
MAIYATPPKSPAILRRLDELDVLRRYLAQHLGDSAQPWTGALRRLAAAEATVGSTSIEGYGASLEDTVEILAGRHPSGTSEETQRIISAYAQAMDRVAVLADDHAFQWSSQTVLDLHFLVCHPQPRAGPGRLRDGAVVVTRGLGRDPYRPPPSSELPALVNEVTKWLGSGDLTRHPVVRAAMAHLNLVSIHPFRDGNGRVARVVQSLVLAKEGLLRPELVSIEPYLGRHTREYYAALEEAQGLAFDPNRDASAWVEFCIEAHVFEATERRRWLEIAYARHDFCEQLAREQGYPERFVMPLDQALLGLQVTNVDYRREVNIASPTATQDLQRLRADGWLDQEGGGRSVRYVTGKKLQERWSRSSNR